VSIDDGRRCWSKDTLALAPWVAVLSGCHPSRRPFENAYPETAAGDAGRELAVRYVLALTPIVFDGKLRKLDTEEVRGTVL
jgi:hypothetical protein